FFFSSRRRHTRSDRDWSSDVCSSDLRGRPLPTPQDVMEEDAVAQLGVLEAALAGAAAEQGHDPLGHRDVLEVGELFDADLVAARSEERRVGKECRSGWAPEEQ